MTDQTLKNKALFLLYLIEDFAKLNQLSVKSAFNYLKRYKGVDFLDKYYEAEHLLSFEDVIKDVTIICQQNGGGILL